MSSLAKVMEKELKIIKRKMRESSENVLYIDKRGRAHDRPAPNVPRSGLRPLIDQEGVTGENGVRVRPRIDMERKKRGKKRKDR